MAIEQNDNYTIAFNKMYEACLSATGAYDSLKDIGADKYLPGYDRCLKDLNEAIALAKKLKTEN